MGAAYFVKLVPRPGDPRGVLDANVPFVDDPKEGRLYDDGNTYQVTRHTASHGTVVTQAGGALWFRWDIPNPATPDPDDVLDTWCLFVTVSDVPPPAPNAYLGDPADRSTFRTNKLSANVMGKINAALGDDVFTQRENAAKVLKTLFGHRANLRAMRATWDTMTEPWIMFDETD